MYPFILSPPHAPVAHRGDGGIGYQSSVSDQRKEPSPEKNAGCRLNPLFDLMQLAFLTPRPRIFPH